MKRFKMGVFNNLQSHDFDIKEYMKSVNEKIQTGFKLDKTIIMICNKKEW